MQRDSKKKPNSVNTKKVKNNKKVIEDKNVNNNTCECGQVLQPGWKFCPKCKKKITVNIKNNTSVQNENEGNVNKYISIFAVCAAGGFFFPPLFLAAIVTIVTAKNKFPKNNTIECLFWITISLAIAMVLLVASVLITCYTFFDSCPG